jgi:predicted peroxiredoxin
MAKSRDLLNWEEVTAKLPKLKFAIPDHLKSLMAMIKQAGVRIECDEFGIPRRLEYAV